MSEYIINIEEEYRKGGFVKDKIALNEYKTLALAELKGKLLYGDNKNEEEVKEIEPTKPQKEQKQKVKYTSCNIDYENKTIVEQIHIKGFNKFLCYSANDDLIWKYNSYPDGEYVVYPINGEEIDKGAIKLSSDATDYENDEKLDSDLKDFINHWLDIPDKVLQFAIWNIKRSWVYERFHTLNYLRALGDTGMGKSRFLDVLGLLHYKPISTSGATTSAPIFRIIDKWKGTIIMDEADFQKSDESMDIIKIINLGYEKGKFIMRCDKNDPKKMDFFDPFCPKVIATRSTFTDKAVESRCITQVMIGTMRRNIPYNLNTAFFEEAQILRNKLLMWRFKNFFKINPDKLIDLGIENLEPRVMQIVNSVVSLFGDNEKQLNDFKEFILDYQEELIEERQDSFAGQVVGGIHSLLKSNIIDISANDIIIKENILNKKGNLISPRGLSSTLKALGFGKTKVKKIDHKPKRCIPIETQHIVGLFKRYGYEVTEVTGNTETQEEFVENTIST